MSDSLSTSDPPKSDEAPLSTFLSHPSLDKARQQPSDVASPTAGEAAKSATRLYVGNLHPSVDEFVLIQTFSKYGKIVKLDFLFHKAGPMKGKPRGYAFVEFSQKEEALQAMVATNDHTLRGRKLMVTFASQTQHTETSHTSGGPGPHRRRDADAFKPTTLSLIKNASLPEGTNAKISAMEAKLAQLRQGRSKAVSGSSTPHDSSSGQGKRGVGSLPPKPATGGPSKRYP